MTQAQLITRRNAANAAYDWLYSPRNNDPMTTAEIEDRAAIALWDAIQCDIALGECDELPGDIEQYRANAEAAHANLKD